MTKQLIGTKTENDVKKSVCNWLNTFPEVVHWDRLNSGVAERAGRHIRLCKPGTPDLWALVRGKDGSTHILFIEVKRPGQKIHDESPQAYFRDKVLPLKNVHHITATSASDVTDILIPLIYDGPYAKKLFTHQKQKKLSNKWKKYEALKSMLLLKNLPPAEYEAEIRELCKRMEI